jgi:nanoRNase/pAp phosphatase (c-di-AMP/oligoRNAs hydrolase)
VAEILSSLFEKYEELLIDEDIATALLTGIITKTNSFQHARTTPSAFAAASRLITQGARQQEIVKNIFKTKPLPLLKIWGRALARLKTVEDRAAAYSVLAKADFEKSEAAPELLPLVLQEFVEHVSSFKLVAVLAESGENEIKIMIALHKPLRMEQIQNVLQPNSKVLDLQINGYQLLEATFLGIDLSTAETKLLEVIKSLPAD